jgi:hypothetical protein
MSATTQINLNDSLIPSVPFLWYREEEMTCPIDYIKFDNNTYTIIHTHILKDSNIYICIHSFLYYILYPSNEPIITIPTSFEINKIFTVTLTGPLVQYNQSLINNVPQSGPVFIHGGAFSPTGFPYFRVDTTKLINKINCNIVSQELGINLTCTFIIFNEEATTEQIKLYIDNHK